MYDREADYLYPFREDPRPRIEVQDLMAGYSEGQSEAGF